MRFSTAGLPSDSGKELIRQFGDIGIKDLELSNFPKTYDLKKLCESKKYLDFSFQLHNYYMQEDKDEEFVMNLASLDDISAQKTIDKIENALSITSKLNIPTIGIGSSSYCDGQILVTDDMLGISGFYQKFVKKYIQLDRVIEKAVKKYTREVKTRKFPSKKNIFK